MLIKDITHTISNPSSTMTSQDLPPSPSDFLAFDIANAYDNEIDHYPKFAEIDPGRQKALDSFSTELQAFPQCPEPLQCIDIGCAHGRPTVQCLAEQGHNVLGLDLSLGMLDKATKDLAAFPNVRFELGDVRIWTPAPSQKGHIDCVTCFYVISHFAQEEYSVILGRIAGWLRPTGIFVLGAIVGRNEWKRFERIAAPISSATTEELKRLLEDAGLEVVKDWEEDWSSVVRPDRPGRRHQFFLCRKGIV